MRMKRLTFITIVLILVGVTIFSVKKRYFNHFNSQKKKIFSNKEKSSSEINDYKKFEYKPYDKVYGTKGEKLIFYIDMLDVKNHLIGDWFNYLLKFSDEGLLQFSVRATNDKSSYAVNRLATDLLTHEELEQIQNEVIGYLNCVKKEEPNNYFSLLKILSQSLQEDVESSEQPLEENFELNSPEEMYYYLFKIYGEIGDTQLIQNCIDSKGYRAVLTSEERFHHLGKSYPLIVCVSCEGDGLKTQLAEFVNREDKAREIIKKLIIIKL
jgi:uncharacterized protein YxeA